MRTQRNNIRAGIFVLVGIVMGMVFIIALGGPALQNAFAAKQTVQIQYHISDGIKGLKPGATVTVGDTPMGTVTRIEPIVKDQGVVEYMKVSFELPEDYVLYENAIVELVVPPLGSGTRLNISSFGSPEPGEDHMGDSWVYEPGEVIDGSLQPSQLMQDLVRSMGIEAKQREQLRSLITNISSVIETIAENRQRIPAILTNVQDLSTMLTERTPEVIDEVQAITGDVKTVTSSVAERSGQWWATVDRTLDNADKGVASARDMVEENRPDVRSAIINVQAVTQRARDEVMAKIDKALNRANEALDDVKQATSEAATLMVKQRPNLEATVANARIVSNQLKLAAIEIRRSPWRLMYSPTERELETDNIYDAARSFADAAQTMDTMTDSLEALLKEYDGQIDPDDPRVQEILNAMHESFKEFAEVQVQFRHAVREARTR